jgi:hypothetical protein
MKKEAWDQFKDSGSINDYLSYKNKQKDFLNEMGTEVIVNSKGDKRNGASRRDRTKDE